MKDEGRAAGGLDPARERAPQQRPRSGRRSPYGYPRHDGAHALPTYAALDLGTNNCRLLVARPTGDSFRVVDAFSRIIRLGEGLSTSGRISNAAIDRAVGALAICRDKMRNRGVTRARLIATEACRAADNGTEFRARIAGEVGLELEIIDRETEATLAATGCTPLMDPRADAGWMTDDEVTRVIERLLGWSHEDRVANACIGAERADLVLAGCAILDAIRRAFPCERVRVADRGLREGMLVQMMREDGVWEGRARGTLI